MKELKSLLVLAGVALLFPAAAQAVSWDCSAIKNYAGKTYSGCSTRLNQTIHDYNPMEMTESGCESFCAAAAIGPKDTSVTASSQSSGYEADQKVYKKEAHKRRQLEAQLLILRKQLSAIRSVSDPSHLTVDNQFPNFDHDCFTDCEPVSMGGYCPDTLFTKYLGVAAAAEAPRVEPRAFNAYYATKFDDSEKKNLCDTVSATMAAHSSFGGEASCMNAVALCRFDVRDTHVVMIKQQIAEFESKIEDLDDQLEDLQDRLSEGCPDCGPAYYQGMQPKPNDGTPAGTPVKSEDVIHSSAHSSGGEVQSQQQ